MGKLTYVVGCGVAAAMLASASGCSFPGSDDTSWRGSREHAVTKPAAPNFEMISEDVPWGVSKFYDLNEQNVCYIVRDGSTGGVALNCMVAVVRDEAGDLQGSKSQ